LLNITTPEYLKFYEFLYTFSWDKKTCPNGLPLDVCNSYWEQLFGNQFKLIAQFVEYLTANKIIGLNKDEWSCFLELLRSKGDQFPKGYVLDDFWPNLFDEFYKDYCTKYGITMESKQY
jgi:hypothetical protein